MWCILSFFFVTFCDCEEWLGHFPLSDEAISMCAKSPERDSESKSAWNSRVGPVAVNLEDSPVINGRLCTSLRGTSTSRRFFGQVNRSHL
jgi:hypothetical protein